MKRKLSFFSLGWKGTVDLLCHYLKTSPTLDRGTLRMRFVLGWKSPPSPRTHTLGLSVEQRYDTSFSILSCPFLSLQMLFPVAPLLIKYTKKNKTEKYSPHNTQPYSVAQSKSNFLMQCNNAISIRQNNSNLIRLKTFIWKKLQSWN